MSPVVRFAKILLVLNGVEKFWPLINNTFSSFFISNDLIALDHCQVLGDKIPGIT